MGTISVSSLGKAYKQYPNRWARFLDWFLKSPRNKQSLKWVLQDVSFTVNPGEAVGIIGLNGAGKSTLLKLITVTTQPTTGNVKMTGRVAAMLELGMGFHPDFTGRQNVYMAGQLIGLSNSDIDKLMPEIEAFAEIADYIDQPVRVYSSGMQVRLAFSVATATRPDILIIDEALSVGDAYFQQKCVERILQFKKLGTTLLIVSHDSQIIQSICDKVVLLNAGRVEIVDSPETVFNHYNYLISLHSKPSELSVARESKDTYGDGSVSIESIEILDTQSQPVEIIQVGQLVELRAVVRINQEIPNLIFGYAIKDRLGLTIFGTNTHYLEIPIKAAKVGDCYQYSFKFFVNLGCGDYSLTLAMHSTENHLMNNYFWRDRAKFFKVINIEHSNFIGSNWMPPICEVTNVG